jgi:hypothetical protein
VPERELLALFADEQVATGSISQPLVVLPPRSALSRSAPPTAPVEAPAAEEQMELPARR